MSQTVDGGAPPLRGRPRVHDDAPILSAVLDLLRETGYQAMSMGDVAERSGVSKPSIYRRWPNKAELVAAAIAHSHRDRPEPTGRLREDLIAEVRDVRHTYEAMADMGMVGVLLSEERRHPEFIAAWRDRIAIPRRQGIERIVRRGQETGEIGAEVSPVIVSELVTGAFYSAYLVGNRMDDAWDEEVVGLVLRGAGA